MSLNSTNDRITASGNGATLTFTFGYKLIDQADLVVITKVDSTGVETAKVLNTDYTLSGTLTNNIYENGVTITFSSAPATGTTVIAYRDKSAIQELELTENGKIPSDNLEKQLDKLTMMVQRVKNKLARSIGLKEGFTATFDPSLPAIMVDDGYLKTKSDGSGLEYIAQDDLINTISTGSQAFTASKALVSSAAGLATTSATSSTEIGYVAGVTSAIQTQLNGKAPVAGALTASRALISNASSQVTTTNVTHAELDYVGGVTSAIQTQLDSKLAASFGIVNNVLSWTDRGTDPSSPSSGYKNTYAKADGMYYKDSSGNVYQFAPLQSGTFTPTYFGSTTAGTTTYTTQTGNYTKIGNTVYYSMRVTWTNATGTGSPRFGGLPFTANATAMGNASISYIDNFALTAANVPLVYLIPNTTTIALYQTPTGGGALSSPAIDIAADILISGFYFV